MCVCKQPGLFLKIKMHFDQGVFHDLKLKYTYYLVVKHLNPLFISQIMFRSFKLQQWRGGKNLSKPVRKSISRGSIVLEVLFANLIG